MPEALVLQARVEQGELEGAQEQAVILVIRVQQDLVVLLVLHPQDSA